MPKVPDGFVAEPYAAGFDQPRNLRAAPHGDLFLADGGAGRVLVFRADARGLSTKADVFADRLDRPYGIAFHPPDKPQHVSGRPASQVLRYPYPSGGAKAAASAEVIIDNIETERHWARDLAASRDGRRLFGKAVHNFTTGLRNCSGLVTRPGTDNLWCIANERDHLGPDATPDFMTRLHEGAFYGWPWYCLDGRQDPALKGQRPKLRAEVRVPDRLIQAHSSALNAAIYGGDAFPAEYRGDAFVALHGSRSRPELMGYEASWSPGDGAVIVSDDANGTIFHVRCVGAK